MGNRKREKTLTQTVINRWLTGIKRTDAYGDPFQTEKPAGIFRCAGGNISGVKGSHRSPTSKVFFQAVRSLQSDVLTIQEPNQFPPLIDKDDLLVSRARKAIPGSLAHQVYNATAAHDSPHLYGGTAVVLAPEAATRFNSFSDDPTGLGRWTSALISGRDGWNIRIVAAYNPCHNDGHDTVWAQHKRYFRSQGNFKDPTALMQKDLCVALESWLASGEHIVLMIDANQCVRTGALGKAFEALGIKEAIISKHIDMQPPPATHLRGSKPIDGIFTTLDPATFTSGYLPFGDGLDSDHRTAWIDIPFTAALGHNPPHLHKLEPSPLTLFDPAIEAKYHKEVTKAYESQKVFSNVDKL